MKPEELTLTNASHLPQFCDGFYKNAHCSDDRMPSVSPLHRLPSLPIIYTPLGAAVRVRYAPTGRRPAKGGRRVTPRRLQIKKVKKLHSMPFGRKGRGRQEGN